MQISEKALKNHELLFPNHKSKLAITDPDLVEDFDNFAFSEVLEYGNLDTRTRLMVILVSLIAMQALVEDKVMLSGAFNVGVTLLKPKRYFTSCPLCGHGQSL